MFIDADVTEIKTTTNNVGKMIEKYNLKWKRSDYVFRSNCFAGRAKNYFQIYANEYGTFCGGRKKIVNEQEQGFRQEK